MFTEADIIDRHTRAQAIDDGTLVAVPEATAREARFRCPVALTAAAWADCVAWNRGDTERTGVCQDPEGRLWDVLWMASRAALTEPAWVRFQLHRWPTTTTPADLEPDADGYTPDPPLVELVAVCGPGDDGEPVITIMQPGED